MTNNSKMFYEHCEKFKEDVDCVIKKYNCALLEAINEVLLPPKNIINKKEFVDIVNELKSMEELNDEIDDLIREQRKKTKYFDLDVINYETNSASPLILKLLDKMFYQNEKFSDISYFIYEINFGKNFKIGDVTDNDIPIDFSNAEELYDYLMFCFKNYKF